MKTKIWITAVLQLIWESRAYVTSGLPGHTHRAWLKKMTYDICNLPAGELSPEMCLAAPQILSAWARNPYISKGGTNRIRGRNRKVLHPQEDMFSYDEDQVLSRRGKECALACEQIMKRLVDERRAGNIHAVADTNTYNALIDAWARSGAKGAGVQRAEQILIEMQDAFISGDQLLEPNTESFHTVIKAWVNAGNGEEFQIHRAQRVLEWMVQLYQSDENCSATPSADCFDLVLSGWAHSSHPNAPRKAEEMLMWMDQLYQTNEQKFQNAKPTIHSFNHIIKAWANHKPQSNHKNTLTSSSISAQRAEDILNHMEILGQSPNTQHLAPNLVSYSTVASAWGKARTDDSARRADKILQRVEVKYLDGHTNLQPDALAYNFVADAYAKSNSNRAHIKARAVLDRQLTMYKANKLQSCKPDVYSYTSVLSSCASLNGSRRDRLHAFEVATQTFQDMIDSGYIAPNHVTYGTMIKACGRLLPPGKHRSKIVKQYFDLACQDGCVGNMVLSRLKDATSEGQFKHWITNSYSNPNQELPPDWTWQVPQHDKHKNSRKYNANTSARLRP
mmetsp:Transcript_2262/g.3169  ORF Transcript_2262/g.3169 Transcript_2262/m.3169 type:complete len:562 (+) Transcript_2262:172-1857(+)